ncbi:hypothetical protein [Solimicrobium silvestre]|nr:hypothetical protein [Solimicrobium silvestre]
MPYGVLFGWGGFWVLGIALLILFSRYVIPMLSIGLSRISRSSSMERNKRTDVRNIQEFLPKSIDFDPARYINLKKGIFLGLNENRKPHFLNIPMETNAPHLQVIGTTGAYKGVALGLMGAQFLERGEAVFFFDPKNDEWAPHVLSSAAKRCGKQFYFINLNAPNGA